MSDEAELMPRQFADKIIAQVERNLCHVPDWARDTVREHVETHFALRLHQRQRRQREVDDGHREP